MLDALAFLTVLPVGARDRAPSRSSLLAFPLVGAAVGAVWAVVAWAGLSLWGPTAAAAAVVIADLALTGGLHLDAVADVADGWASRLPPAQAVEVMREPGIGAVGAAVLVATMIARWSFIALLAAQHRWGFLVAVPVAGRAAMVAVLGRAPRNPSPEAPSLAQPLLGAGLATTAAVAAASIAIALVAAGTRGASAVALGVLVTAGLPGWARRRFGTITGDVIGAAGIVAEVAALALLAAKL